jgi:hypothetical protein
MNRTTFATGLQVAAGCALVTTALLSPAAAQPPGRPEGGDPPGFRDPLRRTLDANHDFELDADELAKAPEALKALDKDGDGKLDREELRPPMGPPPGRGPEGRGPEGRRPDERGPEGRPPRDRDSFDRPPPPRDGAGGPPRPREGFRPGGDAGGRPTPERFVERAKSFDADGDGKLDDTELRKFAETMAERMRAAVRGAGGPDGPPRDDGERPERPRRPE